MPLMKMLYPVFYEEWKLSIENYLSSFLITSDQRHRLDDLLKENWHKAKWVNHRARAYEISFLIFTASYTCIDWFTKGDSKDFPRFTYLLGYPLLLALLDISLYQYSLYRQQHRQLHNVIYTSSSSKYCSYSRFYTLEQMTVAVRQQTQQHVAFFIQKLQYEMRKTHEYIDILFTLCFLFIYFHFFILVKREQMPYEVLQKFL